MKALCESMRDELTLPDSPAPSNNILISFLASILSRLSWFSISSLPVEGVGSLVGRARVGNQALTSLCVAVDTSRLYATHYSGRDEWIKREKDKRPGKKDKWRKERGRTEISWRRTN